LSGNGIEAFHHAVNIDGGAQHLLFHPRRVGQGVPDSALLQFSDDGQKAVVGREKAAELNVVGPELRELRFLIDLAMGVEADEVQKHKQGIVHPTQRAAKSFFGSTKVGCNAHQGTPCSQKPLAGKIRISNFEIRNKFKA
jgi:hypothetical protein